MYGLFQRKKLYFCLNFVTKTMEDISERISFNNGKLKNCMNKIFT